MPNINEVLAALSNLSGAAGGNPVEAADGKAEKNLTNVEPETSERNAPRESVGKTDESVSDGTEVKGVPSNDKKGNEDNKLKDSDKLKSGGKEPAENVGTVDSEEDEEVQLDSNSIMQALQVLQSLLFNGGGSNYMIPPTDTPAQAITGSANPLPRQPLPNREQAISGQASPDIAMGLIGNMPGYAGQQNTVMPAMPVRRPPERTV